MKRQETPLTPHEALLRLTTLCSRAEHCSGEMTEKMQRWGIGEEDQASIMHYLVENKYVDDERFCRAFVNDKIEYSKWGRRKIEQALWMKHIDKTIYEPILDEVPNERYIEILRPMLKSKARNIKAQSDYELQMKLIRFAMSRGFEGEVVEKSLPLR